MLEQVVGVADVIITSGGVSMGAYDVVKSALRARGHRLRQGRDAARQAAGLRPARRPRRPAGAALRPARQPGLVLRLVRGLRAAGAAPAHAAQAGEAPAACRQHHLGRALPRRARRQFGRAVVSRSPEGELLAAPVAGQGSHFVADLSRANGLFVVPEDVTELVAGEARRRPPPRRARREMSGSDAPACQPRPGRAMRTPRADPRARRRQRPHGRRVGQGRHGARGERRRPGAAAAPTRSRRSAVGDVPKGDALAVARIAGIQAVKRTPELIPLAHPIAVHGVEVDLAVADDGVDITATVRTADRTGIEMEALTAVTRRRARPHRHGQGRRQARAGSPTCGSRRSRADVRATGMSERSARAAGPRARPSSSRPRPAPQPASMPTGPGPVIVDGSSLGLQVGDPVVVADGDEFGHGPARGPRRREPRARAHDRGHRPHPDRRDTRADAARCSTGSCRASPRRSAPPGSPRASRRRCSPGVSSGWPGAPSSPTSRARAAGWRTRSTCSSRSWATPSTRSPAATTT